MSDDTQIVLQAKAGFRNGLGGFPQSVQLSLYKDKLVGIKKDKVIVEVPLNQIAFVHTSRFFLILKLTNDKYISFSFSSVIQQLLLFGLLASKGRKQAKEWAIQLVKLGVQPEKGWRDKAKIQLGMQ
jgi:hypothetical protein